MPPLPTTAQLTHGGPPAGRPARSSCCWGTGGKRVTTFRTTGTGGVSFRALGGPGGPPPLSPGAGGPQRRGKSQPGSPGPRLTGVIELHEAKGRHEVLQAAPLAPAEASGVQEEGEVGQKAIPEPEGFGGFHLHGVGAFLRAGEARGGGWPGAGLGAGGRADSRPQSVGLCHPIQPVPRPPRS